MRQERTVQASIFDVFATHEIGRELEAMSRWLDERYSMPIERPEDGESDQLPRDGDDEPDDDG